MAHNDPLVIELQIDDCKVFRILLDISILVDLIFKEMLQKMKLNYYELKPFVQPLIGFDGDTKMKIKTIKLLVYFGRITKLIKFLIVDKPAIYNVILGTIRLH